jgi:hypothetical protein
LLLRILFFIPFFLMSRFWVFEKIFKIQNILISIARANYALIKNASIMSVSRCKSASLFYSFSPLISGFIYKNFNLFLIGLCWLFLILLIILFIMY